MLATHAHSGFLSILSIALAARTIPAPRLTFKRIRQKIGRIRITARVRSSLNFRGRGNDAKAKAGKLRARSLGSWPWLHEHELGLWPGSRQGRHDPVDSYGP